MSHHESAARGADARMVDRMLFFSDAVFAIVLTLLALELRPPEADVTAEAEVVTRILGLGRHFGSLAISFTIGAAFWSVHMRNSRLLQQFDWLTAAMNLVHLFAVTLLPFASATLGQHIGSQGAFAVYCSVVILVSFTASAYWLAATRDGGRLIGGITPARRAAATLRMGAIGIAFSVGLLMIWAGLQSWSRLAWLLVIPIMLVARRLGGPQAQAKSGEGAPVQAP